MKDSQIREKLSSLLKEANIVDEHLQRVRMEVHELIWDLTDIEKFSHGIKRKQVE